MSALFFEARRPPKAWLASQKRRQEMIESDDVTAEFAVFREKYLKEAIERLEKIISLVDEAGPDDILFDKIKENQSPGSTPRPPKEIAIELLRQYLKHIELYAREMLGLLLEKVKELKGDVRPTMIMWDSQSIDFLLGDDLIVYLKGLLKRQELPEVKVGILEGTDSKKPVDRYAKLVGRENIHQAPQLDRETRKGFQVPFFDKKMKPEAFALDKLFTIRQLEEKGNRLVVVTTDGLLASITDKRTSRKAIEAVRPDSMLSTPETPVKLLEKFEGLNHYLTVLDQSRRLITELIGPDGSFRDKIDLIRGDQRDGVSLLRNRMRGLIKEIDERKERVNFQSLRSERVVPLVNQGDAILDEANELVGEHDDIFLEALGLRQ